VRVGWRGGSAAAACCWLLAAGAGCSLDRSGPNADPADAAASSSSATSGASSTASSSSAGSGGAPAACGDGTQDATEDCDDGNLQDGDGCSSECLVEPTPTCGDGNKDPGEECDDGDNDDTDGCAGCVLDCGPMLFEDPLAGHCYQYFGDMVSWFDAETACEAWGGTLAALTTTDERLLVVAELGGGETWVGASDDPAAGASEGNWIWITGEPFTAAPHRAPWHPAEPSETTSENCAEIRGDGLFNDLGCDAPRTYVCER